MRAIQDLNLLYALDALLQEESVTKAAQRIHMTAPAMSRALGRLRLLLEDALLVRAGRGMVLTPYAESLRERVHLAVAEASGLLVPNATLPLALIERTLVVRCNDAVAAVLLGPLHDLMQVEAPHLRLRFVPEGDEDAASLREGRVDLDLGVIDFVEPEIRVMSLGQDHFVGLARKSHPHGQELSLLECFAAQKHLSISRKGRWHGPIDQALADLSMQRSIQSVVPDFLPAVLAVAASDLVCALPSLIATYAASLLPLLCFPIPLSLPSVMLGAAWHPRFDDDPPHRWLRKNIRRCFENLLTEKSTVVI